MDGTLLQCPSASGTWSDSSGSAFATGRFLVQTPRPDAPADCQELQDGASCFLTTAVTFGASAAGGMHSMRISYNDNGTCVAMYQLKSSTMDVLGVEPQTYDSLWTWSSGAPEARRADWLQILLAVLAATLLLLSA